MRLLLKNKTVIIIGIILIGIEGVVLTNSYFELLRLENFRRIDLILLKSLWFLFRTGTLFIPVYLLLGVIGVFIVHKMGWIFANSYFVYVFSKFHLITAPTERVEWYVYLFSIVFILPIIFMNRKTIRSLYKIRDEQRLMVNLLVILIGLLFVFIQGYFKLNYAVSTFEVLDELGL